MNDRANLLEYHLSFSYFDLLELPSSVDLVCGGHVWGSSRLGSGETLVHELLLRKMLLLLGFGQRSFFFLVLLVFAGCEGNGVLILLLLYLFENKVDRTSRDRADGVEEETRHEQLL